MTPVVKEINKYITMLSPDEQEALALALKKQEIIAKRKVFLLLFPEKSLFQIL